MGTGAIAEGGSDEPRLIARTIQTHLAMTDPEGAEAQPERQGPPGLRQLTLAERHYYWPRSMYITPQDVGDEDP